MELIISHRAEVLVIAIGKHDESSKRQNLGGQTKQNETLTYMFYLQTSIAAAENVHQQNSMKTHSTDFGTSGIPKGVKPPI